VSASANRPSPRRHAHSHDGHGHSHGLIDRSIARSREGLKAVGGSLGVLGVTAILQGLIFIATGSVALLADLIHNFGDALTAIPVGIAFWMRSLVAEKRAGYFVVAAIFVSACVAAVAAIDRLINPQTLDHLAILAAAGAIGFIGNELAAQIRLRAGRRLNSPALIADGNHARTDGLVSLAVVASAIVVALGFQLGDPIIGLVITLVILRITWQSFRTIQTDPGQPDEAASIGEPDRRNDTTGPIGSSDHRGHQHESKYTDAATGTSTTDRQGFTGRAPGTYEESYD
jgi:Co/Zn/Cd efflux system component